MEIWSLNSERIYRAHSPAGGNLVRSHCRPRCCDLANCSYVLRGYPHQGISLPSPSPSISPSPGSALRTCDVKPVRRGLVMYAPPARFIRCPPEITPLNASAHAHASCQRAPLLPLGVQGFRTRTVREFRRELRSSWNRKSMSTSRITRRDNYHREQIAEDLIARPRFSSSLPVPQRLGGPIKVGPRTVGGINKYLNGRH